MLLRQEIFAAHRQSMLTVVLLLATSLYLPFAVHAEDFNANGIIETTNTHNIQPLSESHIVLLASMEEKIVMDDTNSPWHGASGPCGGSIEIKDGVITGNGLCAFTDVSGDKFVISWIAKELNDKGGPIGVWEMTDGTGRYSGATASGDYNDIPGAEPNKSTVVLTGKLTIN